MKMKIGVDVRCLSKQITGIGRYTLEICLALSKIDGVKLYLYSSSPIHKSIFGLEKANIRSHSWKNGWLIQFWAQTYLPYWAKKDEIDVFFGPAHRLPFFLSKRIPRVLTIHDLVWITCKETMKLKTFILEKVHVALSIKKADFIIVDTNFIKNSLIREFKIKSQNIFKISLAARKIHKISHIHEEKNFIKNPYFLFVGTIEPRKNLNRLLIAYESLDTKIKKKMSLVIVGQKGWGNINLNDLIIKMHLKKYIKLLGRVDDITLTNLYRNAEFLVMPSLYEGFGLPLVEAMLYGKPSITSKNSSMSEVVGNSGLLVDPLDISSISIALKKMILNNELRERLAKNAKLKSGQFSWDESANKLTDIFMKAIAIRKRP